MKKITKKCIECDDLFTYDSSVRGQSGRKFCTQKCRDRQTSRKAYWKQAKTDRNKHAKAKTREYEDGKNKCLLCEEVGIKAYYHRVGSHVFYEHGMTAREYRKKFDLELKRGMLSPKLLKVYQKNNAKHSDVVVENNLIDKGKKSRFKKGQTGVGVYKRSHVTLERLRKNMYKGGRKTTVKKIEIKCAVCGSPKIIYPRYYKKNNNYCSVGCRNISNNKKKYG